MADGFSQVRLRLPQQIVTRRLAHRDYAPSLRGIFVPHHRYYGLLPHRFTGHFLPVRESAFPHFAFRRLLCGSSVPCAFVLLPALALSFGPAAALIQRDRMMGAFRLSGFDWFHDDICPQRQHPRQEGGHLDFGTLTLTSFYVGYSSTGRFSLPVS